MGRLRILKIIIYVGVLLILAALVHLQIVNGQFYFNQSKNNRLRLIPQEAPRGLIVDRHERVVADNRLAFHVAMVDQDVIDKDDVFKFLSKTFDRPVKDLKLRYSRRKITPFSPIVLIEDITPQQRLVVEENKVLYPGLVIESSFTRVYPFDESLAPVVGYVGKIDPDQLNVDSYGFTPVSLRGKNGVERFLDESLRGQLGGKQIEVNNRGIQVRTLSVKEAQEGQTVGLTIDARLQQEVYNLFNRRRGSAVVMNVKTGEVLVLVSSPSYNPNAFVDKRINHLVTNYFQDKEAPMLNRAMAGALPPGSIFKIIVALAGLEKNHIDPYDTIFCRGYLMLGSSRFGCAHVHDDENLYQAIARSCNIYFYQLATKVNPTVIIAFAKAFGFGQRTGIDLPFEQKGKLRNFDQRRFFKGEVYNLGIGQGETLATPMQATLMMATIANQGRIPKPFITRRIHDRLEKGIDLSKRPLVKLRPDVYADVMRGMRQTITDPQGTANILNDLKDLKIWGKTGTAQSGGPHLAHHAWFSGTVQGREDNLYSFTVMLEHGGSSANAVALTKQILSLMMSYNYI